MDNAAQICEGGLGQFAVRRIAGRTAQKEYSIIFALSGMTLSVGDPWARKAIHDLIDQQEHIETAARSLKAISHPLRLKILCVRRR